MTTDPLSRPAVIEACGLSRTLIDPAPVSLVKDITMTVQTGEFVAVTGPSGSGKSSLLYLLGLLDRPDSGTLRLLGRNTSGVSAETLADWRLSFIGFVFQFHFLLPEFSAQDNVELPMRRLGRRSAREISQYAESLLDSFGLGDHRHKRPDQLSGGQRQRVAIARALANDPALILADEPTGNLDSHAAQTVFDTFIDLAHHQERSVIVVTHDHGLASLADRRIHLIDGRIVEEINKGN